MRHTAPFACAFALAALSGCTGSTDPATATLFDNVRNLNSGEYDRQIAEREARAGALMRENDQRRAAIGSMERQRAANASSISDLRGQIASVQAEIARARASNPAAASQLDSLQRQTAALQGDVASGADPSVARSELGRIRAAVRALSG